MPTVGMKGIKAIISSSKKVQTQSSPHLDDAFEALLDNQDVSIDLKIKLMTIDASVKQAFLSSSGTAESIVSSSSSKSRPNSPLKHVTRKHGRQRSIGFLLPLKRKAIDTVENTFDEPEQFIGYLNMQSPRTIKCETVHRLSMFLRSQPAAWVFQFVMQDGFKCLAEQVMAIIKIEWREDHEDELLSEILACIQGLCTIRAGAEKLNADFLKTITNFLFSDKQPSDFACRGRIVTILETYLTGKRELQEFRATEILGYLADPPKPIGERPLEMLERALKVRPYRRWIQELEKLTKDCFWVFLHNDNVIPVLSPHECAAMPRRAPVVPEGYVGGVEWVLIEYICTHLSLLNKIIGSLPRNHRAQFRSDLRNSNFEEICGSKLTRASTKFYIRLHEELKQWVSDANADSWPVASVTLGVSRDDFDLNTREKLGEGNVKSHRRTQSSFLPEFQF